MFEPLFVPLSDRYHLVAPDYPGFGHRDWPDPKQFAYTFDDVAEVINHFAEALGLSRYTLYMQDYGGPSGFRMIWRTRNAGSKTPDAKEPAGATALGDQNGADGSIRRDFEVCCEIRCETF